MKKLFLADTILLYLMQALFVTAFLVLFYDHDILIQDLWPLFAASGALGLGACGVQAAMVVKAIVQGFKPEPNTYKTTMIYKLVLTPFFVANYYICLFMLGGLLNPWLAWSVPFLIPVMICLTFYAMAASSSFNISYMINELVTKKKKPSALVAHLVLHCLFVSDVISSVVLYLQDRKTQKALLKEAVPS